MKRLGQSVDKNRIAELLIRFEAGHFDPKSRRTLKQIFSEAPWNAEIRLLRACDHLNVTGLDPLRYYPKP